MKKSWIAVIGVAVWWTVASATAAERPRRQGRPSWGRPGQDSGRTEDHLRWYDSLLTQWDANKNGILEANEVDASSGSRMRSRFAVRILQRAGMEPKFPASIAKIREGLQKNSQKASPKSPSDDPPDDSDDAKDSSSSEEPKVPGFGVKTELPPVPGFGRPEEEQPDDGESRRPDSRRTMGNQWRPAQPSSPPSSSGGEGQRNQRSESDIRRYAKSLLHQYDKNRNGVLEKNEWQDMRGDPKASDRNGDGVITLDEMTDRLVRYSRERSGQRRSGSGGSASGRSSDSAKLSTYRFLSPTERLPEGLPDWFAHKDTDADGQVTMAEYATEWSEGKLEAFARYDLNDDGIVTPAECLQADRQE